MNIADLFVRIRGDVSDVGPKLQTVQRSLGGIEVSAGRSHQSMGRLGQEMVTLTRRLLGLNPVVAQATNVLGGLALGSTTMIGILGGVAAVGFAFEKLTESSRKAMDAGDKLSESYNKLAKISALGIGGQQKADLEIINKGLEEHTKWLSRIITLRSMLGSLGGFLAGAQAGQANQITAGTTGAAAARQQLVNEIGMQQAKDNQARADYLKKLGEPAREAAAKAAAAALEAEKNFWSLQHRIFEDARDAMAGLREDARQFLLTTPSTALGNVAIPEGIMPSINVPTSDEVKAIVEGVTHADRNAALLKDAILNSAFIIVNALNIGGGGRGSGLGGALGSTAGFALGYAGKLGFGLAGPVGGAVGGLVGTVFGSLIGGLFDHKKAVDNNTAALNRVASLLNAPSGFKGAYYTYQAEDARRIYRQQVETARREGTRGGRAGFALQPGV